MHSHYHRLRENHLRHLRSEVAVGNRLRRPERGRKARYRDRLHKTVITQIGLQLQTMVTVLLEGTAWRGAEAVRPMLGRSHAPLGPMGPPLRGTLPAALLHLGLSMMNCPK